ncbi:MAG: hypothetical protein ACE5JG_03090, partial [Planctomycetota bacterium]
MGEPAAAPGSWSRFDLRPVDRVMLVYLGGELAAVAASASRNPSWPLHAALHAAMIGGLLWLARAARTRGP